MRRRPTRPKQNGMTEHQQNCTERQSEIARYPTPRNGYTRPDETTWNDAATPHPTPQDRAAIQDTTRLMQSGYVRPDNTMYDRAVIPSGPAPNATQHSGNLPQTQTKPNGMTTRYRAERHSFNRIAPTGKTSHNRIEHHGTASQDPMTFDITKRHHPIRHTRT